MVIHNISLAVATEFGTQWLVIFPILKTTLKRDFMKMS